MNFVIFIFSFLLFGFAPIAVEFIGDTQTTKIRPQVENQLEIESSGNVLTTISIPSRREIIV